jgi:ribonuclease P protein component
MIPRANRLRDSKEFRHIARTGRKYRTPFLVISALPATNEQDRFGFVVPKRVGNAVHRNLAKRRIRAVCFGLLEKPLGLDVVFRAEPAILKMSFEKLSEEIAKGLETIRSKTE